MIFSLGLVNCIDQLGRRLESIVVPLELLQQLKPSDFPTQQEFEAFQKRNLKLLEAGLLLHPYVPLDKSDTSAQRLRQIIRGASEKPLETGKNNEFMQGLRNVVMTLACRSFDDQASNMCHWADGFPLNLQIYQVLLEACFDVDDETSIIEDVDEVLELLVPRIISQFKIALCQLMVTTDKDTNLDRARNMLEEAADKGAKLLVLPEMWVCPYSHEYFAKCAEELDKEESSQAFRMLSKVASSRKITIVGGSIPERKNGKMYNTCCVFGPDGMLKSKHSKLHLFDYYEPGSSFKESDSFTAGDTPTVVDTDVGCIGIGICHDIRFPELAMMYRAKGADLIIYPGAFNMSTGKMLWELETKARAIDNQVFVAVCSPCRDSAGSYTIWGHSMIVGPSGEIKGKAEHEENIVIVEIDYAENQLQRESFPMLNQQKEEIYKFLDTVQSKFANYAVL